MHAPNAPEVECRVSNVIALFGPNVGAANLQEEVGRNSNAIAASARLGLDGRGDAVPIQKKRSQPQAV
jgi:hypothetical protein